MSIPKKMTVKCSKCGAEIDVTVFESVNTDFAEDITEQITSGDLFNAKCDKCGFVSHLEYDVLYHDVKHGAMIWVLHDNSPEYSDRVAELRRSANVLGYKTTRIVNNMNELRQKVACLENGRDDRIIELCKVFIAYNLLSKQPDFDFNNAFYTTFLGKERVFLYDKNGQELSCELTEETYSLLCDLYYNSEYASEFKDYYALVDYDWAEGILQPLLKREAERIDAKNAAKTTPVRNRPFTEKRVVCPKCKQALPEDSAFCHYCGTAINLKTADNNEPRATAEKYAAAHTYPSTPAYQTNVASKKTSSKKALTAILIICAIVIVGFVGVAIGIPEYKYIQACSALDDGLYAKAIEAFEELDGYKDSEDKINAAKYGQACVALDDGSYAKAIKAFEALDGYKDSENKINEAKYKYVLDNKNNNNSTTYEYLSSLKRIDYKNSADIYDDLYEWEITMLAINTNENDESTNMNSISKYDTVYFHFRLTGGKPNETVRIKVVDIPPNGNSGDYYFDSVWEDGDILWYSWGYNEPQYGTAGTLQCKFYDENDNLIGVASVRLTN